MFEWASANVEGIITVVIAAHALALAVVNLTPTPKDDAVVAKIYTVIEWIAGVVTRKAKS